MPLLTDYHILISIFSAVATIAASIGGVQRIIKNSRIEREHEAKKAIEVAKEEIVLVKSDLDSQITALRVEMKTLELSLQKDFDHLKETHASEISNLGEKIENLRDELRTQHGQLLGLLTKLVK